VRLSALAFALAFAIAGMTGVLIALVFPAFSPFSGGEYSIIGFIVIVLGGLGNPVGALIASVFYGVAEQMATVFLPQALAQIVGFALLVGTILVRPTGLFGFRALR
jgi:branched-chain amino acid transport system permease protein